MMPAGVTGRVAPKMLPAMKTASAVAAMAEAAVRGLPAKVRKIWFKFASNLPMKELMEVSAGLGKAALEVARSEPEVVVPVM